MHRGNRTDGPGSRETQLISHTRLKSSPFSSRRKRKNKNGRWLEEHLCSLFVLFGCLKADESLFLFGFRASKNLTLLAFPGLCWKLGIGLKQKMVQTKPDIPRSVQLTKTLPITVWNEM